MRVGVFGGSLPSVVALLVCMTVGRKGKRAGQFLSYAVPSFNFHGPRWDMGKLPAALYSNGGACDMHAGESGRRAHGIYFILCFRRSYFTE